MVHVDTRNIVLINKYYNSELHQLYKHNTWLNCNSVYILFVHHPILIWYLQTINLYSKTNWISNALFQNNSFGIYQLSDCLYNVPYTTPLYTLVQFTALLSYPLTAMSVVMYIQFCLSELSVTGVRRMVCLQQSRLRCIWLFKV